MLIRAIEFSDNVQIANVIRTIFIENKYPKVGTAFADTELDFMFETYSKPRTCYFVLATPDKVYGGAGIAPIEYINATSIEFVCELQKMYLDDSVRGKGYGIAIIQKCIEHAKLMGYTKMYLETLSEMEIAQNLYKKIGFEYTNEIVGSTGHISCSIKMLLDLNQRN